MATMFQLLIADHRVCLLVHDDPSEESKEASKESLSKSDLLSKDITMSGEKKKNKKAS